MKPDRRMVMTTLAAAAALGPATAFARDDAPIRDDGAVMERVAEGVHVILHDDASDEWPHGNTGVIIGRRGVFVIDSNYLPSRARADIALIRRVTDKPVRYLMTTHWHFDHNNGAIAYRDAFPDVVLIAERNTARWLELNATWWAKMSTAPASARRAGLAALEQQLASGKDEAGAPLTPEDRAAITRFVAQRKGELSELETLKVVKPTLLFDDRLNMTFEGVRIEMRNWGPANSPRDTTIYLPKDRILFTGDILVQGPTPYTGASWPVPWAPVLAEIEQGPSRIIVPGHGPVMRDKSYVQAVRLLLESAMTGVERLMREGRTLAQVQDEWLMEDVRAQVPAWRSPNTSDATWNIVRRSLIERAWMGVRGQGGM